MPAETIEVSGISPFMHIVGIRHKANRIMLGTYGAEEAHDVLWEAKRLKKTLSLKEKRAAVKWAEDTSWVDRREYEKDEAYMELVGDILEHPVFLSMEEYIQHGHTTCRAHCIQVSYMAYKLSLRFGLDAKSTARAGLLHDLFLYDWHTHAKETGEHFHGLTHPRTALRNAREHFVLNAIEEDCILRHMWPLTPIPPKYWEGMMIVYADKVCGAAEVGRHVKAWFAVNWIPKRS